MLAALVPIAASGTATAESEQRRLIGCWSQTSPRDGVSVGGREWGTRTWCFRRDGVLKTWNAACGSGGCDAWDGQWRYRWRGVRLELQDYRYDEAGRRSAMRHRCRPVFEKDRFTLTGCDMSRDAFVRDNDPNTIH